MATDRKTALFPNPPRHSGVRAVITGQVGVDKKPFLESPEDVEEFLTKLRTELTNTLARGERIQIK